jgi:protocatechuate 3,4-dioxygenase beta subunit
MCIDEEGRPVSGATVVLSQYEMGLFAGGDPAQTKKLAEQTTGSDGRYRFDAAIDVAAVFPEGVPPMHFQRPPQRAVCVTAQATGRATAWQNDFASEVARNGRLDVLRLLPAGRLTGRILDEAGRPVVGATVATSGEGSYIPNMPGISLFSAVTDAEGRYEIGDIPAYVEADARKKHEAWAEQMRKDEAKSGTTTTFAVATSAVNPSDPYGFVPKPLLVRHGEFARYQGVVPSIPGEVDATLVAGAVIEGRAVTREGDAARPAVGVRVYVERSPDPAPKVTAAGNNFKLYELEQVVTDAEGRYRIGGLGGGGAYRVSGDMGSEWVAVGIAGLSTEAGKTTAAPDLVFTHGGVVRVNLVDAQTKQPLALPGGAKGFLNVAPAPGSPWRGTAFSTGYADFPEKGYLERHALPGKVLVFATILADDGSERYTSFDAAKSRSVEDMPTYDVVEGETLDVALPMRRSERNQTHKARLVPSSAEPATPAKDSSGRSDVTPFQRSNSRAKAQIVSLGTNPATASGSRRTRAGGWELVVGNATKPNPLAGEGTRAGVVDGALVQEPLGEFR